MTLGTIQLRDKVLRNIAAQGQVGASWVEALPSLLRRLEVEWGIKVGRPFPNATEAFVAEAMTADGRQVALKIPIVGLAKADRELSLLQTASGRGYVRLLRHDRISGARLLERLGPQLAMFGLPIEEQIRIICRTLQQAWMPLAPGVSFPTGAEKASPSDCSAPAPRFDTLALAVGAACSLSLHVVGVTKHRFSRSIRKPGRASRRLHAGCRSGSIRASPELIPEEGSPPGSDIA